MNHHFLSCLFGISVQKCPLILADVISSTIQEASIPLMSLVTAMALRKKKKKGDFENVVSNLKTYFALVGVSFCQWLSIL